MNRFHIVLKRDPAGGYTASLPDLPGCVSEGEDIEIATENALAALTLYLDDVETEQEPDGNWIAENRNVPGVLVNGFTEEEAILFARLLLERVILDQYDAGEISVSIED